MIILLLFQVWGFISLAVSSCLGFWVGVVIHSSLPPLNDRPAQCKHAHAHAPSNACTICANSFFAHPAFEMQHLLTVSVPTEELFDDEVSIFCTASVRMCVCRGVGVE